MVETAVETRYCESLSVPRSFARLPMPNTVHRFAEHEDVADQ